MRAGSSKRRGLTGEKQRADWRRVSDLEEGHSSLCVSVCCPAEKTYIYTDLGLPSLATEAGGSGKPHFLT